jgi:hypothetical protein
MIAFNNQYGIIETVHFIPADFPLVISEIDFLRLSLKDITCNNKPDIVISYLKDHSIKAIWANANPMVTRLLTLATLETGHIEALFESCRQNNNFLNEFEEYFKEQLASK